MLPAATGSGESVIVTDKSATAGIGVGVGVPPPLTVVIAVPVLFPGFGSDVVEVTVALLEIVVPPAVPELT